MQTAAEMSPPPLQICLNTPAVRATTQSLGSSEAWRAKRVDSGFTPAAKVWAQNIQISTKVIFHGIVLFVEIPITVTIPMTFTASAQNLHRTLFSHSRVTVFPLPLSPLCPQTSTQSTAPHHQETVQKPILIQSSPGPSE